MAEIVYKSLSSLSPIELKYDYYRNEELQSSIKTYRNGVSFYELDGLNNYKDVAINKESCFILTSAVNLNSIFTNQRQLTIGSAPASIQFAVRIADNTIPPIYFAKYNEEENNFQQTLNEASTFYLQPVEGQRNVVEIFVQDKYVQVQESYPYTIITSDRSLDPESLDRQRFEIVYSKSNNTITFKTLTNAGYRFLTFNEDNILRATGLVLNNVIINDYVFSCVPVTDDTLNYGFKPTNNWVTYFYDVESGKDNKNLNVNQDIFPTQTNLLVDFPLEKAAEISEVIINIANLKTAVTPEGGPAPVNNAYIKDVTTTN